MTVIAEQVYTEAIQLNPIDRAELIEKLFTSFSPKSSTEIEPKLKEEMKRRGLAYENGDIPSDSMENVFERLSRR